MPAPDNTLLKHFFNTDATQEAKERFDLNRKSRSRRMHEVISIVRKHHILRGLTPEQFRTMLEELGPSFVKIGQTLSTRSEILPKAFCDELAKLQTHCDPLPFSEVQTALTDIYGESFGDIFASIDPRPLGSASLAQVHKAVLRTGETVAVKVQRPGVKATMAQDIDIMRTLARRAARLNLNPQFLDLQDVVEEMWSTFLEETDFACEAENLVFFKELGRNTVFVDCPKVYPELCSEYVLVMEYIEGIPIYEKQRLLDNGYDLQEIGTKLLDNYATQILDWGFFHADPHPGNIIVRDGQIIYIDLGIMGRLNPTERVGFGKIVSAVGAKSSEDLKDALISFAENKDNAAIDHTRFLADLDLLIAEYGSCDVSNLDVGLFLNDILNLTRMSMVQLPSSITNVSRGIVTLEGTVADFIPNENIIGIINEHILSSGSSAENINDALVSLAKAAQGATEAARYSGQTLKMLTRGQLKVNMEVLGSEAPLSTVSKIVNRLTLGIVTAGLFVGSALLAPYGTTLPNFSGVPVISFFGFTGAFIISVWIVVDIWRRH